MAPTSLASSLSEVLRRQSAGPVVANGDKAPTGDWRKAAEQHPEDLVLESWSQGFVVGSLLVMACITIANMRKGVLLHKLILLELLLAMTHGTFCFMDFNGYGWYLSSTASLLYFSWIIHNVVAWMKVKPFFTQPGGFFAAKTGLWVQRVYLGTLALAIPVILFQITNNFRFFNNKGGWYTKMRPYEPFFRDPWWVFTCIILFHIIRKCYGTGVLGLVRRSPRFGILLLAIVLSVTFTILDIAASIKSFTGTTDGINPWWKLSLVFKCLTDTIMLDDFKTELKRLGLRRIEKQEKHRASFSLVSEYPSGLGGPDFTSHADPQHSTLFRYAQSPTQSNTFSSDSTIGKSSRDSRDDDHEDPLSEYATQRESKLQQRKRGPNNPNKGVEEVEFVTALASTSPDHNSSVENAGHNSHIHERVNVRKSTKKIGRLPGLKDFRFEAIKPGKKSSRRGYHDDDDDDDDDDDNEAEKSGYDESSRMRSMAEEIQRNTIMDLEAQKREKAARDEVKSSDSESRSEEDLRRLRRFRDSIGAAS